tara:strand:+ start:5393 stop:10264 length:4872 start_codon:yes stop_codon:yes gene_type:complete
MAEPAIAEQDTSPSDVVPQTVTPPEPKPEPEVVADTAEESAEPVIVEEEQESKAPALMPARPADESGIDAKRIDIVKDPTSPVGIRPQVSTLKPAILKSVAEEETARSQVVTSKNILEKIRAGETVTVDLPDGNKKVFGAEYAEFIDDPDFGPDLQNEVQAFADFSVTSDPSQETVYAFKSGIPEWLENPEDISEAELYRKSRQDIDNLLKPVLPDTEIRQIFIDEYRSGTFYDNFMRRVKGLELGVVGLSTSATSAASIAAESLAAAFKKGSQTGLLQTSIGSLFAEEWNARGSKWSRVQQQHLEFLDEHSDILINNPSFAREFNAQLHESLKERKDNGDISEERYNELAYEGELDGKKVLRKFITEETADDMVNLSFNQLPGMLQYAVIVGENSIFGGVLGGAKLQNARNFHSEYMKAFKANPNLVKNTARAEDAYKILVQNNKLKAYNDDIVNLGFDDYRIRTGRTKAKKAYETSAENLRTMEAEGLTHTLGYKSEFSNFVNNRRIYRRSLLRDEIKPYVVPGVTELGIVSYAQLAGREHLAGFLGNSPESGEAVGAISTVLALNIKIGRFGVKPAAKATASGIKSGLGFAGYQALRPVEAISEASKDTMFGFINYAFKKTAELGNKFTFNPTFVQDYETNVFIPMMGRAMSMAERSDIRRSFTFINKLDGPDRERFFAGLKETSGAYERVINAFPEGSLRDDAVKMFSLSFGEMSMLPVFAGAKLDTLENLNLSAARGERVLTKDAFDLNARMERSATMARRGLDAFEQYVMNNAIPARRPQLMKLISEQRKIIQKNEEMIQRGYSNLERTISNMEANLGRGLGTDLPPTYVEDLNETKMLLKEQQLGRVLTLDEQRAILDDTMNKWYDAFEERMDTIKAIRDNEGQYTFEFARAMEDLTFAQMEFATQEADTAYNAVRGYEARKIKAGDTKGVDISEAVQMMMDISGETDIAQMFRADGVFFQGAVGKKSRIVFDRMVDKGLKRLDPDAMSYYQQLVVDAGVYSVEEMADLLKTKEGRIEFGLILHQYVDEVNLFSGVSLEEADILRRAFRDYGFKTKNKAVNAQYGKFQDRLDEIVESQDPKGFELLSNARTTYQDLIGDTARQGGTFARLQNSQKGGTRVAEDLNDPYRVFYAADTPAELFNGINNPLIEIMRGAPGNRNALLSKMQVSVSEIARGLGDRVFVNPQGDVVDVGRLGGSRDDTLSPVVVFDLRTEEGRKKLRAIQGAVEAAVYDVWARDATAAAGIGVAETKEVLSAASEKLRFVESENARVVESNMMISVIEDGSNRITQKPLTSLEDIYQKENDIVDAIAQRKELHIQFEQFKNRLNIEMKDVGAQTKIDLDVENQSIEFLKRFTGKESPRAFFESYIEGVEDIGQLRDAFIENARKAGRHKGRGPWEETAAQQFDNAVLTLTYNALLDIGQYKPTGGTIFREVTTDAGDMKFAQPSSEMAFEDTGQLLMVLRNNKEQLDSVLGAEGRQYLEDLVLIMNQAEAQKIGIQGIPRGMSLESLISKAYNWKRGMVGTPFLATELGIRLLNKSKTSVMLLAMQNVDAARIMVKIVDAPETVDPAEWRTFDIYMKEFLMTEAVKAGHNEIEDLMTDYSQFEKEDNQDEDT